MRNVILRRCGFFEAASAPQDDSDLQARFARLPTERPKNSGVVSLDKTRRPGRSRRQGVRVSLLPLRVFR